MSETFLFYDIETTGLNPAFDQILQFAAIRTDSKLNELARHEYRVKLRPDVIPSPHALLTNQISLQTMLQGETEFEVVKKIHALFNTPGTISLGYNTLGFDDEFLRFSFYRNLLSPYTHQYANQCSRMDIYPVLLFYYLFNSESVINWPIVDNKLSLKLESLNTANNFNQGQAHNAVIDVETTIALTKALMKSEKIWQYCQGYFTKHEDAIRLSKLGLAYPQTTLAMTEGLYIAGNLGSTLAFQIPVLLLGQHNIYKNQSLWLRLDLPELACTTFSEIEKTTWIIRKKPGEPGFILPSQPRFLRHLSAERLAITHANKAWLLKNPLLLQAIIDYHLNFQYPLIAQADIDSVLYQNGFFSNNDQALCRLFHTVSLTEKLLLIEKFESLELQELAVRLLARNFEVTLPNKYQELYTAYLKKFYEGKEILIDYRKQMKFNVQQALQELSTLNQRQNLTSEQQHFLLDYSNFINQRGNSDGLLANEIRA